MTEGIYEIDKYRTQTWEEQQRVFEELMDRYAEMSVLETNKGGNNGNQD
jgi:hypothetical protein